ncbi:hypothetical protein Y032_0078g1180 [Ancylostoma ceylanicum]|uniref:Uncharacterized protein n=1 Tax=Ancylostoma ceylanicum TaxID=53326 RepID=A0A016TU00_9BILA|nr:hypothetical protein Y032_0078g1180 [Ancylostoma ceylanicum]
MYSAQWIPSFKGSFIQGSPRHSAQWTISLTGIYPFPFVFIHSAIQYNSSIYVRDYSLAQVWCLGESQHKMKKH